MTSGDELTPLRRTRRELEVPAPAPTPRAPKSLPQRWSRRRGVLGVFAAFAALGFVAAYAGPTGMAIAETTADEQTSLYASALEDVQVRETAADAAPAEAVDLGREGYSVYVTPKPTPTPTPKPVAAFAPPRYEGGGSPAEWMAAAGIPEADWGYVNFIVAKESGWNPNAVNRSSGACGLVQVYPCSKLANAHDPIVNLTWANNYANGRYGSWAGAYNFWTSNRWW